MGLGCSWVQRSRGPNPMWKAPKTSCLGNVWALLRIPCVWHWTRKALPSPKSCSSSSFRSRASAKGADLVLPSRELSEGVLQNFGWLVNWIFVGRFWALIELQSPCKIVPYPLDEVVPRLPRARIGESRISWMSWRLGRDFPMPFCPSWAEPPFCKVS